MLQYVMFEARIRDIIPQLIEAVEIQKEYFHPQYKDILSIYSRLQQDLENGVIK